MVDPERGGASRFSDDFNEEVLSSKELSTEELRLRVQYLLDQMDTYRARHLAAQQELVHRKEYRK